MKKIVMFVFLVVLSLVALVGCSNSSTAPESSGGKEAGLAPYVVGVTYDLSGLRANIGIANQRGFEMALEEINAAGGVNGRQIKAVFYDGKSNPTETVKAVSRIIEVDKAAAVIGPNAVDGTMASLQTATDAKIVMLSSAPALVTGAKTPEGLFSPTPDQKVASIPVLIENLKKRGSTQIAYIRIDTTFGELGLKAVEASGLKPVIAESYAAETVDFTPQLTRIKSSGADGLIITGNLADTVKVIKSAKNILGADFPIVSDYAIVSPEFIKLGGQDVEGIVTTSLKALVAPDLPANDVQKEVAMGLYDKYTKKYGEFSLFAGHGWDQAHLLAKALEGVKPELDPTNATDLVEIRSQIKSSLEGIKGFVGQNGVFNFSPTNHIGLEVGTYILVEVRNGKWTLYNK